MNITYAIYGGVDRLNTLLSRIHNGKLCIRVDNSLFGDPKIGQKKHLEVEIDGQKIIIEENKWLIYPVEERDRLGVWYTTNRTSIHPIKKSLDTIKKASDGKADIITCVWERIAGNPFQEILSHYKSMSHLNQILQIMQCLYTAIDQNKNYKYVSFLEHDVMYPEGYFDYPNFIDGEIYTNMNYGGLSVDGWQIKKQNDEPMHQMTMTINDALKHMHHILGNALVSNSGNIEDQRLTRKKWQCANQSIHINHGRHFTSHYSIYKVDTDNRYYHKYWGDHKEYTYLLK